jgi:hypothetical protein
MKRCVECGEKGLDKLLMLNDDVICTECADCGCMEWKEENKLMRMACNNSDVMLKKLLNHS